jgi:hypothetical protein
MPGWFPALSSGSRERQTRGRIGSAERDSEVRRTVSSGLWREHNVDGAIPARSQAPTACAGQDTEVGVVRAKDSSLDVLQSFCGAEVGQRDGLRLARTPHRHAAEGKTGRAEARECASAGHSDARHFRSARNTYDRGPISVLRGSECYGNRAIRSGCEIRGAVVCLSKVVQIGALNRNAGYGYASYAEVG